MLTTSLSRCKGSYPRTCTHNSSSSKYWCSSTTSSNQPILYLGNNLWTLLADQWLTHLSSPVKTLQTSPHLRLCPLETTSSPSTCTCLSCRLNKIPKWAALCLGRKGRKCLRNKIKDLRVMDRAIVNIMDNNNMYLKNSSNLNSTPYLRIIAPGPVGPTWVPPSLTSPSRQPTKRPCSSPEASTNLTWGILEDRLIIKSLGVKIYFGAIRLLVNRQPSGLLKCLDNKH